MKLVLETDGEGTTSFQRSIVAGRGEETFTSQYALDGRTVTWAAYEEKLKSFGILVKARNFLVFQVRYLLILFSHPLGFARPCSACSPSFGWGLAGGKRAEEFGGVGRMRFLILTLSSSAEVPGDSR